MNRTQYGTSIWLDRVTTAKGQAFARLKGTVEADVVVIGGGLTGSLIACQFARAGIATVLVDAGEPGAAAALDAGWVVESPGLSFRETQALLGLRDARRAFEASRRAALDVAAFLRRLAIPCDLTPRPLLTMAFSDEQARALEREHQARVAAGLDSAWIGGRRASAEARTERASGAVKTHHDATIDPLRACRGILAAAAGAGATVFARTTAQRIRPSARAVEVTMDGGGSVRAQTAIVATGAPRPLVPALQRHVRVMHSYHVATADLPRAILARLPGSLIVRDAALPPHVVARVDGRLLVQGGDQPAVVSRLQEKALVQRTGQLMYELSLLYPSISGVPPACSWSAPRVTGRDGLMLVGSHRNFPRHLFALGLGSAGIAGAWLAARILLRQYTGRPEPADEVFGFSRFLG